MKQSITKRVGKWVVICFGAGLGFLNAWMVLHDQFPSYVPIAEIAIPNAIETAQNIYESLEWDHNGLVPQSPIPADNDYRFVFLPDGYYPLPAIPPQYNSGQYIHPSGQQYI